MQVIQSYHDLSDRRALLNRFNFGNVMVLSFFRSFRRNQQPAEIYGSLVAQARSETFYTKMAVPDTMTGRFDMVVLHVFLFMHRIRDREKLRELGQEVFDIFFQDLDASLRESGMGDLTVPKRLKKMANSFYGQVQVYSQPLDNEDISALSEQLKRNLQDGASNVDTDSMATYLITQNRFLASQNDGDFLKGNLNFVSAIEVLEGKVE